MSASPALSSSSVTLHPLHQAYLQKQAEGGLKPDPLQAHVVSLLTHLAITLEEGAGGHKSGFGRFLKGLFGKKVSSAPDQGLYIYGGVGRGKSTLMDLFFETVRISEKRRVHFHAFMKEVHTFIQAARLEGKSDPLIDVARHIRSQTHLLCFDEFYVNDITDAMILGRLFTALFEQGIVCVMTSNRHPDMLYPNGLNRELFLPAIALLKEKMTVVALDGENDYRLMKLGKEAIYITPLGDEASQVMHHHWNTLTESSEGASLTLSVYGREFTLEQVSHGVLWLSFDRFFKQPLAAADYLEIARHVHTVMIADVPQMSPENRNEAVRFRLLIDTLYEAKRRLIMSAASDADHLYTAGDLAFDFQRTASRLHEMTSHDYLKAANLDYEEG